MHPREPGVRLKPGIARGGVRLQPAAGRRSHGTSTTFSAAPSRNIRSASSIRSSGSTVGSGTSSPGSSATASLHERGRRRPRADDRQLAPVNAGGGYRPRVREQQHRPAWLDRVERDLDSSRRAHDGSVDGPVRWHPGPQRVAVDREHRVPAPLQHGAEEPPDESVADHEHPPSWHALHATQHAGERLHVRPVGIVDRVRKLHPPGGAHPLGEAAGNDRRLGEPLTGRLVPREAAVAVPHPA